MFIFPFCFFFTIWKKETAADRKVCPFNICTGKGQNAFMNSTMRLALKKSLHRKFTDKFTVTF